MKQFILAILAMFCFALPTHAQAPGIKSVNPEVFSQSLAADSVQLLDVRTVAEYAESHIAQALLIDVRQPDFKEVALSKLSKSRPVYVYCRSGKRSLMAAQILAAEGFEVVNLAPGILGWIKSGLPVEK